MGGHLTAALVLLLLLLLLLGQATTMQQQQQQRVQGVGFWIAMSPCQCICRIRQLVAAATAAGAPASLLPCMGERLHLKKHLLLHLAGDLLRS
jgi:hypothetical protein